MYPRNNASPERISVGAVVQISDGAVQTSGVSVTVLPQGGTSSASGGTIGYEQGVVTYLPTQAETNYSSFVVTAYKSGCLPASVTVVTSASSVAGYAILGAVTHTGAVIPTVSTLTGHTAQTGDAFARLGAPVGASISADVAAVQSAVTTVDGVVDAILVDTAEIGAAGAGLTAVASAANLATVAGYLDTEIASIKAKTDNLPASPAAVSDIPTAAAVADAVWDESLAAHAISGSTGEALSAAGGAGDPWITALPGSYTAGQAGYILGTNLDATVSSRATQASVDTVDGVVDAILVDTAEIGAAGAGLTAVASAANLATLAGYVDTEVAAIKAKTDALPASPAATGDIPTALQNADALLNRDMSAVTDSTARSPLNALRFIRNKWSISGTTLTVTKEDDTTSAWTATVTAAPGADPISGNDPA